MKRSLAIGMLGGVMASVVLLVIASVVGAQGKEVSTPPTLITSASTSTPISSTFTYQGQLKSSGSAVNDPCDFQFGLWDAVDSGSQVGITQTLSTINVTNGLFTVAIDFGANAFNGDARWLAIVVRCPAGSGNYAALNPRQALTSAPYALYSIGNWGLNGNSGTRANNFLGTTDNTTLTLGVSNTAILRLIPARAQDAPIMIGGYAGNTVGGLGDGATIAGGGSSIFGASIITGNNVSWSVIGGGMANQINGGNAYAATIGGGSGNVISGTSADHATIGGGASNTTGGRFATIPGGFHNVAAGDFSFAAGRRAEALHWGSFVWADSWDADFASTGDNQFLIRANGGVGINTNAPTRMLDVNGIIGVFDGGARTYNGGLASEVGGQLIDLGINDDATNRFGGGYSYTAQGGLFRVDARANQDLFQFYGRAAGSTSGLSLLASLNTAGVLKIGGLGSAGATSLCLNGSNQIASCSSSVRYKDNITALNLGLDVIAKLQPVTFNWKDSGQADLGFVAEEVNQVSPILTTLNKDGQIEGVKYDRISAVLVNAVQEQQQQIAALKTQNADLATRVSKLQEDATASNPPAQTEPFNVSNLLSTIALIAVGWMGLQQRRSKRGQT